MLSVFDSEIVECGLILVLRRQAGVGQVAVDVAPFAKAAIVEHLEFVGDDKRYDAAVQALLEHDETPHTTIAVLERVNLLEADVQVEDVLQRVLRLDFVEVRCDSAIFERARMALAAPSFGIIPLQKPLHAFLHPFRLTRLFATHLVRQTLIVAYGKPVLAAVAGSRLQDAMQLLDQLLCKRLLGLVDDQVDATEVVDSLHDVIYIYRFVSSHTDGVCLKDIARLLMGQTAALNMVRVVGQVYLRLVIDAAIHLHRLLLAEYVEQSLFMLVVVHLTNAFCGLILLSIVVTLHELLDEGLGDLEGMVGNGVPEVVILRGIGVAEGDVADDSERDEGHVAQIAGLGDGCRLHIDGFCLGEVADDLTHLLLRVYKPVACNDEARVKTDV